MMKSIAFNVLAVLAGIVAGGVLNMLIVVVGPMVIPLPEGADVSTPEAMQESMKLFTPKNFICPFLAHALGTLLAGFVAAKFARSYQTAMALCTGMFFLAGGIAAVNMLGGPVWFIATDLLLAYIPMALLGAKLATRSAATTSDTESIEPGPANAS